MKYCKNCGEQIENNALICPHCGEDTDYEKLERTSHVENDAYSQGIKRHYTHSERLAIVGYLTWIGFLVALLTDNTHDSYLRFHLNQSLIILIFGLLRFLPVSGKITLIIFAFKLVCWIICLTGAVKKEKKKAPVIGKLVLIKEG